MSRMLNDPEITNDPTYQVLCAAMRNGEDCNYALHDWLLEHDAEIEASLVIQLKKLEFEPVLISTGYEGIFPVHEYKLAPQQPENVNDWLRRIGIVESPYLFDCQWGHCFSVRQLILNYLGIQSVRSGDQRGVFICHSLDFEPLCKVFKIVADLEAAHTLDGRPVTILDPADSRPVLIDSQ